MHPHTPAPNVHIHVNREGTPYLTPWAIICRGDVTGTPCEDANPIELTELQYIEQLCQPDAVWKCPKCHGRAFWDDNCPETNPPLVLDPTKIPNP